MVIYIDDCLIIAPSDAEVMKVYSDLKTKFKVTNKGPIDEYLGVKVEMRADKFNETVTTPSHSTNFRQNGSQPENQGETHFCAEQSNIGARHRGQTKINYMRLL